MGDAHDRVECSWAAGPRPRKLYKYKSLDGAGLDHVRQIVNENQLWMSPPADFNDPWEGLFLLDFGGSDSDKLATYRQMIRLEFGDQPPHHEVEAQAQEWLRNPPSDQTLKAAARASVAQSRACLRILSLTEKPDDLLMWSHYADSHRGICLEFDTTAGTPSVFTDSLPVNYQDSYPVIGFYRQEPIIDKVRYVAFTKSVSWSHEKEWRVVKSVSAPPVRCMAPYPQQALTAIILGNDISAEHASIMVSWGSTRQVEIRRARRREGEYRIDIVP